MHGFANARPCFFAHVAFKQTERLQWPSDEYPIMPPKIGSDGNGLEVSPFLRHDLSRNGGGLSIVLRSQGVLFR
jgi:hypothetical protein